MASATAAFAGKTIIAGGSNGFFHTCDLEGKKIGINSFGSSADFAAYMSVRGAGIDQNIGGSG